MKKKLNPNQGSLFNKVATTPKFILDPYAKTEAERIEYAADFVIERHKIYLRKSAGRPKPWTSDPVFRVGKFTNIWRQLDPGTVWIQDNIITPYEDHPHLWFMLAIARIINWPDTLQEMMDEGVWPNKTWNPDKTFKVLQARQRRTGPTGKLVTGAYIVNSVFPKDYPKIEGTKAEYIPYVALAPMWNDRKNVGDAFKHNMTDAMTAICKYHGIGPFIGNQILVDLSYSKKWLGRAPDINTFTSPGPGTTKGMNWMISGHMNGPVRGKHLNEPMIRFRGLVNNAVKRKVPARLWTGDYRTGFTNVDMSGYSNVNCELSKMVRSIIDGDTGRMKNKYNGLK